MSGGYKQGDPVFLRVFRRGVQRGVVCFVHEDDLGTKLSVRLDEDGHLVHCRPENGGVRPVDAVTLLGELA